MIKYIDADEFIKELNEAQDDIRPNDYYKGLGLAKRMVSEMAGEDVAPVKHGHWVITEYEYLDCSNCGEAYYIGAVSTRQANEWLEKGYAYPYCPYCGAKMEAEE